MISKSKIRYIKSLHQKKLRNSDRVFLVEGAKNLAELFQSDFKIQSLFLTNDFFICYQAIISNLNLDVHIVSAEELDSAGTLQTNQSGVAVVEMKDRPLPDVSGDHYTILLDGIQDPGNLGTIIRIADWYGVKNIVCSEHTADFYNPKVIGATMGSFTRISVSYGNLGEFLLQHPQPIYGALLNGNNVHETAFLPAGYLLIGNESTGLSAALAKMVQYPIGIPKYGGAESLNAAVATGIILDNIQRTRSK